MDGPERLAMKDFDRAFETIEPKRLTSPLVFSSPHSGSIYPERFLASSRLDPLTLRRSEDAYVDELFLPCVELGAPLLRALFPRAYLDVNREPYELDPQVFEGRLPDFANTRSLRVAVGLGTIPRVVGDSQPIYKQPMSVAEGLGRIQWLYRPYHEQLRALVERALATIRARGSDRLPFHAEQRRGRRQGWTSCSATATARAPRRACRDAGDQLAVVGIPGPAQQAVRRGVHHRAFRRARRRASMPFKSRSHARSISTSAGWSGPNMDGSAREPVQRRPGSGAGIGRGFEPSCRPSNAAARNCAAMQQCGDLAGPGNRGRGLPAAKKRRPPCCHGGLQV